MAARTGSAGGDALAAALGIGVGASLGLNAVLAAVGYFSVHLGQGSFVLIACALYLPSLPVALVMFRLDSGPDEAPNDADEADDEESDDDDHAREMRIGKLTRDTRSVIAAFGVEALALLVVPLVRASIGSLLLVCCVFGVCAAVAMEYALQMILLLSESVDAASCAQLKAALFTGYQASSLLCLFAKFITGFDPMSADSVVATFFVLLAVSSLLLTYPTMYFARCCTARLEYEAVAVVDVEGADSPGSDHPYVQAPSDALEASDVDASGAHTSRPDGPRAKGRSKWREAFGQARICAVSLFLTLFSSMFIFPFYAFVPSSAGGAAAEARLASVLFYAKTFADAASRPATVILPSCLHSEKALLFVSLARCVIGVPLFFLYVFGDGLIPTNDVALVLSIVAFSFSSGYLNTLSFQLLPADPGHRLTRQVSTVMNIAFQCALFAALALAALLSETMGLY